jgi:carboxypeptidase Q
MFRHAAYILIVLAGAQYAPAQAPDALEREAFTVKAIFETALRDGMSYRWLEDMCTGIGHRLSGSAGAAEAVEMTKGILDTLGLDTVWLQPCIVPRWIRGEAEVVRMMGDGVETILLRALALGNTIGTEPDGVTGEVIEVLNLEDLQNLPDDRVRGKIVFFNRPMEVTLVNTFHAYGRAVDQRWAGPRLAAEKGAIAAVVRSMTTAVDTFAHTGSTDPGGMQIPAVAISTVDADLLSSRIKFAPVTIFVKTTCAMMDSVTSFNVIGEIRGTEHPEEIILVGGHLDSWDVGHGAHDDGAGCMQSMDVLYLLRKIGYTPRRTIRCVLFMNEENGLAGARAYAMESDRKREFHLAAIESDAGGFRPMGFGMSAEGTLQERYLKMLGTWWSLLEPYGLSLTSGGGGADISPLRGQGGMLIGLRPDSQRYFDYHHSHADTIDKVHPRELKLGSAAMTALVILLDKFTHRVNE